MKALKPCSELVEWVLTKVTFQQETLSKHEEQLREFKEAQTFFFCIHFLEYLPQVIVNLNRKNINTYQVVNLNIFG